MKQCNKPEIEIENNIKNIFPNEIYKLVNLGIVE